MRSRHRGCVCFIPDASPLTADRGYVGLMAIARAAAWYQLIDLKKLVRRAGLRFLLVVFRTGMLRFLVRLLDI